MQCLPTTDLVRGERFIRSEEKPEYILYRFRREKAGIDGVVKCVEYKVWPKME